MLYIHLFICSVLTKESLIQFNLILYFNSHRAIQFFTVYQVIYVINYFTENKFRRLAAVTARDTLGLTCAFINFMFL